MKNTCKPTRFNMAPATELPSQVGHYVTPKARDAAEIARRQAPGRRSGMLIVEEQTKGLEVVTTGFKQTNNPQEFREWASAVKHAAIGTALYLLGDPTGETAQRYTRLPQLAATEPEHRPTASQIRQDTTRTFETSTMYSYNQLAALACGATWNERKKIELATAKTLIHAAFLAECVEIADTTSDPDCALSNRETQLWVRDRSLALVHDTVSLGLEHGTIPSVAQLAPGNPYSDLVVAINNTGTDFQVATINRLQAA